MQLRDFQQEGAANIRAAYAQKVRSVLWVLPTGGGKTYTFTYITKSAASKGNNVGIIVHRQELLMQASMSLASMGVEHGIIAPAKVAKAIQLRQMEELGVNMIDQSSRVQVASVQALSRPTRLGKYAHLFKLLIVDEAHHSTAGQWRKTIEACHHARVLGVTATPIRADGQGLGTHCGGLFDQMILGPSIRRLIDNGYLCQPLVYAPPMKVDLSGIRKGKGDYNKKQMADEMDKPTITGDAVDHYSRLCPNKPAIAFCASIEHAEHVAQQFRSRGYKAASVSGDTPDEIRRNNINGLSNGSVEVLTSCDIVSEGTDIPVVEAAILLRPTMSTGLYLQQVGRSLRPVPGKENAIILDHVGNCLEHGLPDEEREWTLDGRIKRSGGNTDGGSLSVRQCPKCFAAHVPSPICPVCKHVYPIQTREIEEVEGELQQVDAHALEMQKRQARSQVAVTNTREELEKIAEERGYKKGWVDKMIAVKVKQGRMTEEEAA